MNIVIKNLKKYYKDKLILDIPYLEIKKNEITGIVGENGCGKSTLLNIISGIDKNFSGKIYYNDKELNNEISKNITLVFQKPRLLNSAVYKNLSYPLSLRKIKKEDKKNEIEKILKLLEIENLKDKKATKLSGGEQQKVALARALIFKPKVLMLDEATSNIDCDYKKTIEKIIVNYNTNENNTIILVSHDKEQIKSLCDNVIFLDKQEGN
ncbi:ABC transporter ATP-binding protein [Romboutsia sedimentorum]|uniref:ABC transporter ATP-binding protein n=1 Tax=Romboutsia sedimentorum TaxID=1368474 RepID=A0ABT7EC50_9FIRM|nr:ABC transporter ATP-binding protein [Romboutsia sedimentorum]MDK2563050.1 ABC transporter ATP-binding protein [Romboutsia sedimentorum]MDK2586229.1 ABC transporter ATP-binding protein [Romboutsia sedimentorum]